MKKQIFTYKNRYLLRNWRKISVSLFSVILLITCDLLTATAALKNHSDRLAIASANNIFGSKMLSKADIPIKGKITDQNSGEALIGVSIKVKGTNNGVSTDANGSFSLNAP